MSSEKYFTKLVHHFMRGRKVDTVYGTKYVVELAFHGESKSEFWLSPKQYERLCDDFDLTPDGEFSRKGYEVHVVLKKDLESNKTFYVWSTIANTKSGLKWLNEKFGVDAKMEYD